MELDKTYTLEEAKELWGKNGISLPDLVAFARDLQSMSEKKRGKILAFDEARAKREGQMLRTLTRLLISYRLMQKGGVNMTVGVQEEGILYRPVKKASDGGDNTKKLLFYAFVVALAAIAFYLGAHSVTCSCAQPDVNVTGWIANGTLVTP